MSETPFRLDWNRLLSDKRQKPNDPADADGKKLVFKSQNSRTPFERDYDRIVFSTPFRRLAKKTQVHPFAEFDQIHNRLTHTLEVASVGRSLGAAAHRIISERGELPEHFTREDIICIVQAACLAHDIGNPPFGHAGEDAIREWAKAHLHELFGREATESLYGPARDWQHFEGNAQAFRMMATADDRETHYFLLTYASLGAMIKYPWLSTDKRVDGKEKLNVFSSEESVFNDVVDALGLRRPDGLVVRHPLSFLSEAADDICYRICDFEDAVQMRILSEAEVREIFIKLIGEDTRRPLSAMRAQAISSLIDETIAVFEANYDAIMTGDRDVSSDLKSDFPELKQAGLTDIRERYPDIFNHRPKVAVEIGAYGVLSKILGTYTKIVKELAQKRDFKKLSFIQRRCLELAWGEDYVVAHQDKDYAWWLSRVLDFVSGMTDNYATRVAGEIEGV